MIKGICILLLLLLLPSDTKAVYEVIDARCTPSLKTELREESMEFTYRLSKTEVNNETVYNIYFYNVSDNIDLVDENGNRLNKLQINNLKQGTTLTINLVASNNTYCNGYKTLTRTIKIPYYNKYYGSDLCKGYENVSLCSENERILYDENEFKRELEKYKESLEIKEENDDENIIETKENLFMILYEYRYYIIGTISVVFIITIFYIIIKKHKNKGIL